ncbi:EAL domain-containing protein [Enterobacter ludwigii]|uniref:EAL domain-containing protein n=1 Tax=Enterobacter ludwigii TaxID=299767 RepID=UPI0039751DB0
MKKYKIIDNLLSSTMLCFEKRRDNMRAKMLRKLTSKTEFIPFVQPIFSTSTTKLVGCEVLLRMKTSYGYISPSPFIAELETSIYMNDITITLLQRISLFYEQNKDSFPERFYFSFNIIPHQLLSQTLIWEIMSLREAMKGRADIVLEIVERSTPLLDEDVIDVIDNLTKKGIHFAIDDFGSGSASLRHVECMDFTMIKIDRELTLCQSSELFYPKVINAIITLSKKLDLIIIAEGVENEEQMRLLSAIGVDAVQGYYLAKPMRMDDFRHLYLAEKV